MAALALAVALASGCRSIYAKGTPFYAGPVAGGEFEADSVNRCNIWPLVYYREPNLSVVWPSFETTDDHLAVRPFFSIYGLDTPGREYNYIWPLVSWEIRPDGGRSLRVLFIPVMRKTGKAEADPVHPPAPASAGAGR